MFSSSQLSVLSYQKLHFVERNKVYNQTKSKARTTRFNACFR